MSLGAPVALQLCSPGTEHCAAHPAQCPTLPSPSLILSASCHWNSFHFAWRSTHAYNTCNHYSHFCFSSAQMPSESHSFTHSFFLNLTLLAESAKVCILHLCVIFCLLFIPSFGRIEYQNKTIKRKKKRISKQSISHWIFPFLQKQCCNGYGRTVET